MNELCEKILPVPWRPCCPLLPLQPVWSPGERWWGGDCEPVEACEAGKWLRVQGRHVRQGRGERRERASSFHLPQKVPPSTSGRLREPDGQPPLPDLETSEEDRHRVEL